MDKRRAQIENYFRVRVESASPMGLVYILYEGALKDLHEVKRAYKNGNKEHFTYALTHAQNCIRELRDALKLEEGATIAQNLYRLYSFCLNQLVEGNLALRSNPLPHVQNVERILSELLQTWRTAEKSQKETKKVSPKAYGTNGSSNYGVDGFSFTG